MIRQTRGVSIRRFRAGALVAAATAEHLDGGETLTVLLVFAPDTFAD